VWVGMLLIEVTFYFENNMTMNIILKLNVGSFVVVPFTRTWLLLLGNYSLNYIGIRYKISI
jgi:hypothetical protein